MINNLTKAAVFLSIIASSLHSQVPEHVKVPYHNLLTMINSREFQAAILQGKKLIAQEPDFIKTYELMVTAYTQLRTIEKGRAYFDAIAVQYPDNSNAIYALGLCAKEQGDCVTAIKRFKTCIDLQPDAAEPFVKLVECYAIQDSLKAARDFLLAAQNKDSCNAAIFYGLACTFEKEKEYDKAAAAFAQSIALDSSLIDAYYRQGLILQNQKKFAETLHVWQPAQKKAIELHDVRYEAALHGTIGNVYRELGEYSIALSCHQRALELASQLDDLVQKGTHLNNIGNSYKDLGQSQKALDYFDQAIQIAVAENDSLFLEALYGNKSAALADLSRARESIEYAQKALKMAHSRGDTVKIAGYFWSMGVAHTGLANMDSALFYYNKALIIKEAQGDLAAVCSLLSNIGTVYRNKGDIDKAIAAMHKALTVAVQIENKHQELSTLGGLGYAYAGYGVYDKAAEYLKKAVALSDSLGESKFKGTYLGNLGVIYKIWGDYEKAVEYINRAVRFDLSGQNWRAVVRHYGNLANIHEIRGDFVKALDTNYKNLSLSDSIGARDYSAMLTGNIGVIYDKIGDYEKAIHFCEKALEHSRSIPLKAYLPSVLANLASIYHNTGHDSLALACLQESLELSREIKNKEKQFQALRVIGDIYQHKQNFQKAEESYNEAWALIKEVKSLQEEGRIKIRIGDIYFHQKKFDKAASFYHDAFNIAERINAFDLEYMALSKIADTDAALGKFDAAIHHYDQAIQKIESVRGKLHISSYRTMFMENKIQVYEEIIALLIQLGRFEEAYDYLQRFRLRSFLEILSPDRIDYTQGISPDLHAKLKHSESCLRLLYEKIGAENQKEPRDEQLLQSLSDSLDIVRRGHENLWNDIRELHPNYAQQYGMGTPSTLKHLTSTMPNDVFLLEYFIFSDMVAAWIINKDTFSCHVLGRDGAKINKYIEEMRSPFIEAKKNRLVNLADVSFDAESAFKLYQNIFQPLEKYLNPQKHIIIIPDGFLHYLPFEALVTTIKYRKHDTNVIFSRYKNMTYLIEKYSISYLPSAALLRQDAKCGETTSNTFKMLAIGRPDFGAFAEDKSPDSSFYAQGLKGVLSKSGHQLLFRKLRSRDAEAVSQIMTPSLLFTDKDATEINFKKECPNKAHLYLSTHALVEENRPLYSLLAMAQAPSEEDDGFIHTFEIFNLNLKTELVTLSACETGLGKLSRGEGFIGLTNAFFYAGAHSLLVSLWSVEESTSELMTLFYSSIRKNKTKADALRRAKLALIKMTHNGISFSNPYLWAPFVLIGDWRN